MYEKAKRHFKKVDPKLYEAARTMEIREIGASEDLFRDIIWTIVGQQLSSVAANTIYARLEALFGGKKITPERVLALSDEKMRACGLSGAKTRAIRNVAQAVRENMLDIRALASADDDDVLAELVKIKGIGPWTAQMVLMFSLGRPDIFSFGDLGLRKGIIALYGFKTLPGEKKLLKIVGAWSPYRTYAARVLWQLADTNKNRVARKRPGITG